MIDPLQVFAERCFTPIFGAPPLLKGPLPKALSSKSVSLSRAGLAGARRDELWSGFLRPAVQSLAQAMSDAGDRQMFGAHWALFVEDGALHLSVVTERNKANVADALAGQSA